MKKILAILILVVLAGCATTPKNITTNELDHYMTDEYVLLDVRTPTEVSKGKIDHPNYKHINILETNFIKKVRDLDKDKTYLTICKKGGRSSQAASTMRELGFQAINIKDGMEGWKKRGEA